MKKILITIITIFAFEMNINAVTGISYTIGGTMKHICSNDLSIKGEIPFINLNNAEVYFLKPESAFNLDLKTYEYDSYDNYNLPSDLKDYFYGFLEFKKIPNITRSDYHVLTQRLVWDYLYPELQLQFCTSFGKEFNFYDKEYNEIKNKISSVVNGPDFFKNDNYLLANKEYTFEFEYLSSYDLISKPDNLNVNINDDKLNLSGENGVYKLIFKKKPLEGKGYISERILSDGNNALFSFANFNDKEYVMNVIIESVNLTVIVLDENGSALNNECIILNNSPYCTNENGLINIPGLAKNKYNILYEETEDYESYSESIELNQDMFLKINLKAKKNNQEIININNTSMDDSKNDSDSNDNITNNDENYANEDYIIFKDTLSINKIYVLTIVLFLFIGVIFCYQKLKK